MKPYSDGINAFETKLKNLQFGSTQLLFGMIGSQMRRGKFRRFNLTNVKSPVNTIILFTLSIKIVYSFNKTKVKVLCFEIFKFQFSLYIYTVIQYCLATLFTKNQDFFTFCEFANFLMNTIFETELVQLFLP